MNRLTSIDTLTQNDRIYIYGTGSAGKSLMAWLNKCRPDIRVKGFIDSFKNGTCARKPVFQIDRFIKSIRPGDYDRILIASGSNQAIARDLGQRGIDRYSIVVIPSYLMENLLPLPLSQRFSKLKIKFMSFFYRRSLHLFFGEHGGKFIGNNKYYFIYFREKLREQVGDNADTFLYWVTEDSQIFEELKREGINVLNFNEKGFNRYLYKSSHFYFDNMTWQRKYPFLRFFKAKIIHMSHGVGLKMTEKMLIPQAFMEKLTAAEVKRLEEPIFKSHLLVSTSDFYARNVSEPAYGTPLDRIICSGYPKNDLFYRDISGSDIFTGGEIDVRIEAMKDAGYKIIVYAPTFRDMDNCFKYAEVIDYKKLDQFLAKNKLIMVIKGHTSVGTATGRVGEEYSFDNILFYPNDRDGYPMLKLADLLITDYSSIYMDFLHCRKPIVFFVYDYDEYILQHREIQFDYNEMTPGPKARFYEELCHWITHFLISGEDGFDEERQRILSLAFTHHDGKASERIFKRLEKDQ